MHIKFKGQKSDYTKIQLDYFYTVTEYIDKHAMQKNLFNDKPR